MGCGSSAPEEYEIPRPRQGNGQGSHRRRRASVEASVPRPLPAVQKGKRYPKEYRNAEGKYKVKKGDSLMEFPTDYQAHHYQPGGQNAKGHARNPNMDPGFTRTITNQKGKVQGVSYHPPGNPRRLDRASEVRKGKMRHY